MNAPAPTGSASPLSFAQQRLWFVERLYPGSASYVVPMAVRIGGNLDAGVLRRCLTHLVERHEALRTVFSAEHGTPSQEVQPPGPVPIEVVEMPGGSADERIVAARRSAADMAAQPFDLETGPILRARLLRLAPEDHVLVIAVHHIAFDGWSQLVFWSDFAELYRSAVAGVEPNLPELPVRYSDYAVWQRDWLNGPRLEQQVGYWRNHLAGMPHALELPTDLPRLPSAMYEGGSCTWRLPAELVRAARQFAAAEGATLYMTLLAALQLVLARQARCDDVAVGSPIANRVRTDLEGVIGCFVNTLVMRTRLAGCASFRELLRAVRRTALDAFENQDTPFEYLVDQLKPRRDLSRNPLVQVMFQVTAMPIGQVTLHGLRTEPFHWDHGYTRFDLEFAFVENASEPDQGLTGYLAYRRDLFHAETIARLADTFTATLETVLSDPDAPLEAISVIPAEERALETDAETTPASPVTPSAHAYDGYVCSLFAEIFETDVVSIEDNFFDLGGHSMMAAYLTDRISEELQVELSLREFYEAGNLGELAATLSRLQPEGEIL